VQQQPQELDTVRKEGNMRYDCLIIDVHNMAHMLFNINKDSLTSVSKKQVYKNLVRDFISRIETLRAEHLHSDGQVYLLFDNPTSRIDLQSSFYFASRKEAYAKYKSDRAKSPKEFYNSVNLLKFYYLVCDSSYHTAQITRLEADDLVAPLLATTCKDKKCLMVTTDLDWARYLSNNVHWVQGSKAVATAEDLACKLGFPITETSIVAYKVLFGDPSDNIPSLISSKYKKDFPRLLEKLADPSDLPFMCTKDSFTQEFPFLKEVYDKDRQCRINLQLVNSIPVSPKHLAAVLTTGRDSKPSQKAVLQGVGSIADKGFVFGNLHRPRV
jgi:hypothetical protein